MPPKLDPDFILRRSIAQSSYHRWTGMAKEKILVIDDEEDLLELVRFNLTKEGYKVVLADSGEVGLALANSELPDIVLLDLMLPGLDGLEICKSLKASPTTQNIPVIILSAKGDESDVVTGLELGADDYVVKPFSPRILLARIKNVLKRKVSAVNDEDAVLNIDQMCINPQRREVLIEGKAIELTFTEFSVLHLLARQPGSVLTRCQIVNGVRGSDYPVTDRSVDVQIVGLRKKLGNYGKLIETVRGVGYRFKG
jgi:two-component system, OmpR family, alkaline phosphatase synthesis response regulator PhoP